MMERNEYPRPQFRRDGWQNLNGVWEFDFLDGQEGAVDIQMPLNRTICVPFSYQWEASGIGDRGVHEKMLYRRRFRIEKENEGKRALLCFNGVDYEATVFINGTAVMHHEGGFTPFQGDITGFLRAGENEIAVYCVDTLENAVPRGKQSWTGEPFTCFYYPNSGIWQSVWLEFFGEDAISAWLLQPDVDRRAICGTVETLYAAADELELTVFFKEKQIKKMRLALDGKRTKFTVDLADNAFDFGNLLWWPDHPRLVYIDLTLLCDGKVCDRAHTRLGLRKLRVENGQILLNDRPLYQRLVLDQGYWKETGLTPPSAEALKKDIELAMAMGFNGARKHQKLEDPYFYYYADEMGFLTWCEMPSAYTFCEREVAALTAQWQEIVSIARNFTSVVAYVPLNESWGTREIKTDSLQQNFAASLYYLTKALDNSRLISTNDGFENVQQSDILSIHDYAIIETEQFSEKYNGQYDAMNPQGFALFADGHRYQGQPVLLTEFGGIAFVGDQSGKNWGYGNGAKDEQELLQRLRRLAAGIAKTEFQGYCYTQLTDVEQEVNGLLYADRTPKADLARLKDIFGGR